MIKLFLDKLFVVGKVEIKYDASTIKHLSLSALPRCKVINIVTLFLY
jgi:hypothetical protein